MNATSIQPDPDDRAELARLLPAPVERDLPSGRHQRLQEFVMTEIHQTPRRSPKRRTVFLASALTAVAAATAAAVVIGTGGSAGSRHDTAEPAVTSPLSGRQVLLAAATTAERAPKASGTYWYVKTVYTDEKGGKPYQLESWTRRDGQVWWKGEKTRGKAERLALSVPFRLGGPDVSFEQLQKLPTKPNALRAWIAASVKHSDIRTSAGKLDAAMQKKFVFDGLISLVSQLPAPPKVRAAAFRAIASYPNVKDLGPVSGGHGLSISWGEGKPATLVVDPRTSQITRTDFFVSTDGAEVTIPGGATILAEWTNLRPK